MAMRAICLAGGKRWGQEFEQQKQIKVFNRGEKKVILNPRRNALLISLMSFKLTTKLLIEVKVFCDVWSVLR